jgi:hypothetical protein
VLVDVRTTEREREREVVVLEEQGVPEALSDSSSAGREG